MPATSSGSSLRLTPAMTSAWFSSSATRAACGSEGVSDSVYTVALWFQWDYFEERVPEAFKGQVGWYTVKLDSPDDAVRIAKAIDHEFSNSPY